MQSLLVVDDQEIFRAPLVEALREIGYDVREASTAPAALELAMRRKPDLMLLDLAMPNIDGFELLRYFRARAMFRSVPVILLTAHARRDYLAQAATFGIKDYLLKSSFSLTELADRIRASIGAPFPTLRGHQAFPGDSTAVPRAAVLEHDHPEAVQGAAGRRQLLERVEIRAFPGTVAEILALAADPHSSLSGIESVLRRDPALSAQVMVAANAPGTMRGAPCSTLEEALRLLGMSHVVRVVSSGSILTPTEIASDWGRDLRRLWSHSLATGRICQRLHPPKEEAFGFLLGLLHELPELLSLAFLGNQWESWKAQGQRYGWTTATTLGKAFECDFADLARDILARVRLPESIALPLREHHEFFQAERPMEPRQSARTIEVAHQMAVVLGRSGGELAPVSPVRLDQMRALHAPANLGVDLIPMDIQITQWEQMGGLVEDETSPGGLDPVRVLYWRPEGWYTPDPLEALLQKLCHANRVETFDELRSPAELKILLAEPGTPEWTEAGTLHGRVLVLHRASLLREKPATVRTTRLPLTESVLARLLQEV